MKNEKKIKGDIILYNAGKGQNSLEVRVARDTIWLNLNQIAELFNKDKSVISRHFKNIFGTNELKKSSVVAKSATTAKDGKIYQVEFYNLDAIISVGYRVNSKRGTQFRIWATKTLKNSLVAGKQEKDLKLKGFMKAFKIVSQLSHRKGLEGKEAVALLQVISEYANALDLLDDYDHQRVRIGKTSKRKAKKVSYEEAKELIVQMKEKFGHTKVFGQEKDDSLHSSLNTILQSFNGKDLYPSIEEKAGHLLYFLIKNHSFVDGNKRIGAAIFLRFAEKNNLIYDDERRKRIADNALVAMTLMIAESKPKEKNVMIPMLINLISI